tara:strand:- start:5490 stop:8540 length:3051 start_codon:yes stop_codon:yes gene_type:complete
MLNATDYAAYSRATGRPYPQNEEERAEMYPEVRNFRNNQLKSEDENNIGENIAIGALGLGGLALGTAAGRRALANRQAQRAASSAGGRRGGVGFADLARRREPTPSDQYRSSGFTGNERPTAAERTDLRRQPQNLYRDLVDKYPDPGVGKDVEYRPPTSYEGQDAQIVNRQNMMIVDPETGIMYPRGSSALSEEDRALMARRQRIQEINTYPDAPRKSNRPMGGPLAVVGDGSIDEVEASRQLARRQFAQAQIDERVNQLIKDLEPDVERESRAMMGQESARQTRNVNEVKKIKAEEILREIQQEDTLVDFQKNREPLIEEQSAAALNTAEDQSDGRFLRELQRNEDIDMTMVNEDVLDASSTQSAQDALFRENQLVQDARDYLIRQEIDLKYDYTPEESRQAAAVGQALERIQNNPTRVAAEGIIDELRTEARAVADRARFAKEQRQGKTGELPGYRDVDNIRQRREQKTLSAIDAPRETIETVLTGEDAPIETNLQGRQLRGGKVDEDRSYYDVDGGLIDRAGDVRFYGAGGETTYASTGARVAKRGEKYKPKVQLEAMFNRYSDDELEQIASNKARIPYGDMMQQDLDELQTAQRVLKTRAQTSMDKGVDMSGPQYRALSRGRKGLEASETSRKRFENQPPVPVSQPVQDVARSMETLRQGMSVEPSEPAPVTPDIRNIGIGFEGDKEVIGAIGPSDVYTGAARDAAGSLKDVVVGESAPLVQGGVVSNPEVAAEIEDQSQAFLQRAISGGLTQKQTPGYVYTPSQTTEPVADIVVGPGGRRRQLEIFGNQPLDTPYLSTGKSSSTAVNPNLGPEPSQRLGYARYYVGPEATGSKPAGVVTGVSPTVNIDYASMPQSDAYRPTDVGRTLPNLSANPAARARTMSFAGPEAPTRTVYRDTKTGYDYITSPLQQQLSEQAATERVQAGMPQPIGPLTQSPGLPKIGRVDRGPAREGQATGPVITQYGQNIRYPNMRGQERFTTEQLMNDPALRGGPVKMPNRFRDQFVVERPRGY